MIDTVVFRIHNLKSKYAYFVRVLKMLRADKKDVIKYAASSRDRDDVKTYQYYADTDKVRYLRVRNSIYVPSSHYSIAFSEDWERDFLEINLSVPKYYFGTNVFQFVDNKEELPYHVWTKFERFLVEFFKSLFPALPDFTDVEVNRMDMCFNQIFLSKDDALKYLSNQKQVNVVNARSDTNRFNNYGSTTIQYITANYTFKIYHKGTEFRRNDLRELVKQNPKNYDLKELNDIAERMLRYEITFRKGGLNYVFRQHVRNDVNTYYNHNLMRMHHARTKDFRKFIEHDSLSKSFSFHLASEWDLPAGSLDKMYREGKLTFNYELFVSLHDFFMKRVGAYQFDRRLTVRDVNERLKEYSERQKARTGKGLDVSALVVLGMLSQYTDIRELKGILPHATFYRYMKKLKEADIPINNEVDVHAPPLDYTEYFNHLGKYHYEYN